MPGPTVEQLESLVGKEYAIEPVSSSLPHPILADQPHEPRLAGTREISLPMPLVLVPSRPRSSSYMVRLPHPSFWLKILKLPLSELGMIRQFSPLLRCALTALPSDPSFAAFPTYPVSLFLKGSARTTSTIQP